MKCVKETWKEAYRIARQPDLWLADPYILEDIPIRMFLQAISCAGVSYVMKGALK